MTVYTALSYVVNQMQSESPSTWPAGASSENPAEASRFTSIMHFSHAQILFTPSTKVLCILFCCCHSTSVSFTKHAADGCRSVGVGRSLPSVFWHFYWSCSLQPPRWLSQACFPLCQSNSPIIDWWTLSDVQIGGSGFGLNRSARTLGHLSLSLHSPCSCCSSSSKKKYTCRPRLQHNPHLPTRQQRCSTSICESRSSSAPLISTWIKRGSTVAFSNVVKRNFT